MNDNEEIVSLFMRSQHKFKAYAFTLLLNWTQVEDALQDTAVYLYNHKDDFEKGTNAEAWIISILKHRCFDIIHKEKKERSKAQRLSERIESKIFKNNPEKNTDMAEALQGCLKDLPHKTKSIVELYYKERKKGRFISLFLKMKEDAVYKILSRVRDSLKICIQNKMKEI
ncbi:MAG: hypothetical protein COA79_20745 [Planctomycetota bacterium]|nr:MAG: hypothetical protein COA79_20745 [Planctomycetota bacterium]